MGARRAMGARWKSPTARRSATTSWVSRRATAAPSSSPTRRARRNDPHIGSRSGRAGGLGAVGHRSRRAGRHVMLARLPDPPRHDALFICAAPIFQPALEAVLDKLAERHPEATREQLAD